MIDAFDTDVLIYAVVPDHPLGRRVARIFRQDTSGREGPVGVGSVLLLPELLAKPVREGAEEEVRALGWFLARLDLRPVDRPTADLAVALGATYRLRTVVATHLATAVIVGAERFITDNRKDFPESIAEIDVTYPDMLDAG